MNFFLFPLLLYYGLLHAPKICADDNKLSKLANLQNASENHKIMFSSTDSSNSSIESKQTREEINAVKTVEEAQKLEDSVITNESSSPVTTTIPPLGDQNATDIKNTGSMTTQLVPTAAYDKLEKVALMQTFPFLEQAEKKYVDEFSDLLHDPRLTKDELHKERENWAKSQLGDVQKSYRKWEFEKKENKKQAIALIEKIVEGASPEVKALYEKIKTIIMNLNITRRQECELIRQVMEAAEQKVQDEFFTEINMNLVNYCLKRSQPQSVRSVSVDKTISAPSILPINPVQIINDPNLNATQILQQVSQENRFENNSLSSSESEEKNSKKVGEPYSNSRSVSGSSEAYPPRRRHRKKYSRNPYILSNQGLWPLVPYMPYPYLHSVYQPAVHSGYISMSYVQSPYVPLYPYVLKQKRARSHHSLKYLKKKLKEAKSKKRKMVSVSSFESESEMSESEEKPTKKRRKNKRLEVDTSEIKEHKNKKRGGKVKIASSEEKEKKSQEKMENEQKTTLSNSPQKLKQKSDSSSEGSSASSSGTSNSNESNVHRPKKTKHKINEPIKFVKLENFPALDKIEQTEKINDKEKELLSQPKLEGGVAAIPKDEKSSEIEQVSNVKEKINLDVNEQVNEKIAEDKKENNGEQKPI